MTMTDPISDCLTRIRNASRAKHKRVDIPASKMKVEVARILMENHFIANYKVLDDGRQGILRVYLKYQDDKPVLHGIERVSRPVFFADVADSGCRIHHSMLDERRRNCDAIDNQEELGTGVPVGVLPEPVPAFLCQVQMHRVKLARAVRLRVLAQLGVQNLVLSNQDLHPAQQALRGCRHLPHP